jgi:EAL domain-containing protein (putative c-di-GMP-specific phosphodiesterase class I)
MAFQPIVDLNSRAVIGLEALARFPDETIVSPQPWFAAAAEQGLVNELELLAAASAVDQLTKLPDEAFVALNVSSSTAASAELREVIAAVAPRVVLEIKEGDETSGTYHFSEAIKGLRELGVRVAVDDAGLGDVRLRQTLDIQPDIIKVDTTVTRGVDLDPVKQAIVTAFSSLAVLVGATSLAEGIETEEEFQSLVTLGVAAGQGFLLGRPAYLD